MASVSVLSDGLDAGSGEAPRGLAAELAGLGLENKHSTLSFGFAVTVVATLGLATVLWQFHWLHAMTPLTHDARRQTHYALPHRFVKQRLVHRRPENVLGQFYFTDLLII